MFAVSASKLARERRYFLQRFARRLSAAAAARVVRHWLGCFLCKTWRSLAVQWIDDDAVGDLAETIALLLPEPAHSSDAPLAEWVARLLALRDAGADAQHAGLAAAWRELDRTQRLVWNKLITGSFRVGVSQTLVIRALALGEVGLADWWRVMRREILAGLALGGILGSIGFLRITLWSGFSNTYGPHWMLIAITVAVTLIAIVLWGTVVGSLLPIVLRRLGFDPATSSAPFVATLVDVTGLLIYFSVAMLVLRGTLL